VRLTLVACICRMGKKRRSKAPSRPNVAEENRQHRRTCKKGKSKRKNYDVAQAEQALQDVADGMSVKKAAHKWGIPRTTLNDIKLGRYSVSARPGPSPILNETEEKLIEEWIVEMSRRGIPLIRQNVLDSIQRILSEDQRPNPFPENRPGSSWFKLFLGRHPAISEKQAESITRSRGALTEGCIRGWFKDAREYFTSKKIDYILSDPTKQYNGDETGFQLDPKTGKILGPKGESVYTETGGSKEQMTTLITTRADGKLMTTVIVYPYKKSIPKSIVDSLPASGFSVAKSDSGWMSSAIFFEYLANTFVPELARIRREEKGLGPEDELVLTDDDWVVYWVDGYSSHLTYHTSQLCEFNHIVLYCFKAHSSHVCQPNDVGPFKPLKHEWRKAVMEWRTKNPFTVLNKIHFAETLAIAISKLDRDSIIAGYRSTGLCPFNEKAVHYERLTATNQRNYDDKAFETSQEELNHYELALNALSVFLGEEVISQYERAQQFSVVDLSSLPTVHSYLLWSQMKSLANGWSIQNQVELPATENANSDTYAPTLLLLVQGDPVVHSDPVVQGDPVVHADPEEHADPAVHSDPVVQGDPVVHSDPVVHGDPVVHADPEEHADPAVHSDSVVQGDPVVHGDPVVYADPEEHADPAVHSDPLVQSDPVVHGDPEVQDDPAVDEVQPLSTVNPADIGIAADIHAFCDVARMTDDVCLISTHEKTPTKIKRGVPVWYAGKVSPAFEKHVFWPSPPKKVSLNKKRSSQTQLFPACASSQEWRMLYRQKQAEKNKTKSKSAANKKVVTEVTSKQDQSEIKQQKRKRSREKNSEDQVKEKKRRKKNSGKSCIYSIG